MVYKVLRHKYAAAQTRNTGRAPSLKISAQGSFACITQHMGPTALGPIRRMQQKWEKVSRLGIEPTLLNRLGSQ